MLSLTDSSPPPSPAPHLPFLTHSLTHYLPACTVLCCVMQVRRVTVSFLLVGLAGWLAGWPALYYKYVVGGREEASSKAATRQVLWTTIRNVSCDGPRDEIPTLGNWRLGVFGFSFSYIFFFFSFFLFFFFPCYFCFSGWLCGSNLGGSGKVGEVAQGG